MLPYGTDEHSQAYTLADLYPYAIVALVVLLLISLVGMGAILLYRSFRRLDHPFYLWKMQNNNNKMHRYKYVIYYDLRIILY